MAVAVADGVVVGVWVRVAEGMMVAVSVGVGVLVGVGVGLGVSVGVLLGVAVAVAVGVGVLVAVAVSVEVGVSVGVEVSVLVAVGVLLRVGDGVVLGVDVTVGVIVLVKVKVGVGVPVGTAAKNIRLPGFPAISTKPPMTMMPKKMSAHKGKPKPAGRIVTLRTRFSVSVPMPPVLGLGNCGLLSGTTVGELRKASGIACGAFLAGRHASALSKCSANDAHDG